MLGLKYSYYVNEDRFHGFQLSIKSLRGYLLIAADFTITEEELKCLVDNDVVVLSTDHHDCQSSFIDIKGETAEGIVINNQYPFEPEDNRYQSGAGVFYELICSIYPEFESKERKALVGVTLLSDVRQIENSKARSYLQTTYSIDSTEGYIHYLITSIMRTTTDFTFGVPKLDRNFIDYNLSPCINALLRFNRTSEAVDFILGKGLATTSFRDKQKTLILEMESKIQVLKLPNLNIIAVNGLDFLDYNVKISSFIGLLCSSYKDKNSNVSTLGFVFENGKIVRTSFRGKYDDVHYLSGFKNLNINAKGHPNAFGIPDFNPTEDLWVQLSDTVTDMESMHTQTVTIIDSTNLMFTLTQRGASIASENCYVRDMYRTYIKYKGSNAKIIKQTYRYLPFTDEDYRNGVKPDKIEHGDSFKYQLDLDGNPVVKYIEYQIDGRKVKSFGVTIEEGVILPILEKGYMQLYLRSPLN